MDAMTKMWISFVAIILMVLAAFTITFARQKTKGVIRFIVSLLSFILLFIAMILALISLA